MDSKILFLRDKENINPFKYSFQIDKIKCEIFESKENIFTFTINNKTFMSLLKDQNSGKLKSLKEKKLKEEKEKIKRRKRQKIKRGK